MSEANGSVILCYSSEMTLLRDDTIERFNSLNAKKSGRSELAHD